MDITPYLRSAVRWSAAGLGLAAASYATWIAVTWSRYGHAARPASPDDEDLLLDRFIPAYEVVERHHVWVAAPAGITLAAACDMDLQQSAVIRAIFRGRELILGSDPEDAQRPRELLAQVQALGWGVLAENPGREVVVGAVTQPWKADVVFRALPPDEFADFHEPGYVKIVWTLRADPIGPEASVFRTETRAVATDPTARAAFRRYWSFLSPGIVLIRRLSLGLVKAEAERRARAARPEQQCGL
jgi:hypothetical protein